MGSIRKTDHKNDQYAVLDLGSNSFRMLLVRRQGELIQVIERVKEKVQLVRGFRDGRLDPAAIERALSCLRCYAQRLVGLSRGNISMVGTHALRAGTNSGMLADAAEAIIGVPLRILSGEEEAALIYCGVQMHEPSGRKVVRHVVDIGGGSTEFAWGDSGVPAGVSSCMQGCVSLTDRFFQRSLPLREAFDAASAHLQHVLPAFDPVAVDAEVIGTSGTIESVQAVLAANGWSDREITAEGLAYLVDAMRDGHWDAHPGMLGLDPERVDVFPAGVALLGALFRRLGIAAMRHVGAALEDGVMFEMLHAGDDPDGVTQTTVRALQTRHGIDEGQARRVRDAALALFDQGRLQWSAAVAPAPLGTVEPDWRGLLGSAAELHELGLVVSSRGYHRHGAYLLKHADLRGFSPLEREYLVLLVRGHRRGLPMLAFSGLAHHERRQLIRLVALLRIAVILERSHSDAESPRPTLEAGLAPDGDRLRLVLPRGWLGRHPLSRRELAAEPAQLATAGIGLEVAEG